MPSPSLATTRKEEERGRTKIITMGSLGANIEGKEVTLKGREEKKGVKEKGPIVVTRPV